MGFLKIWSVEARFFFGESKGFIKLPPRKSISAKEKKGGKGDEKKGPGLKLRVFSLSGTRIDRRSVFGL